MFDQVMRLAGNILKGSNLDPQGQAQRHMMAARASNIAKQKVTVLPSAMNNPAVLIEQRRGPQALYSYENMPAVPLNPGIGPTISTDPAVLRQLADEGRI